MFDDQTPDGAEPMADNPVDPTLPEPPAAAPALEPEPPAAEPVSEPTYEVVTGELPVCDYTGDPTDEPCEEPATVRRWSSAAVITSAAIGSVVGGLLVAAGLVWALGMWPGVRAAHEGGSRSAAVGRERGCFRQRQHRGCGRLEGDSVGGQRRLGAASIQSVHGSDPACRRRQRQRRDHPRRRLHSHEQPRGRRGRSHHRHGRR